MKKQVLLFVLSFVAILSVHAQVEIPSKPSGFVLDLSGVLKDDQKAQLEQKLRAYDDSTSTQIAIVLMPSTKGSDPYDVAMEIGKSWGVGQKGKNNGVVLLVATEDRKIRIVTGRGIEDVLPDATCKRIINRILKPALQSGDYDGGLNAAIDEMMARASGSFKGEDDGEESKGIPPVFVFMIIFVIISIIKGFFNRNNRGGPGSRGGGGMFFPPVFFGGGDFGSRGNGGGGGGGFDFGGFGGGDFGGGGAGGDF